MGILYVDIIRNPAEDGGADCQYHSEEIRRDIGIAYHCRVFAGFCYDCLSGTKENILKVNSEKREK